MISFILKEPYYPCFSTFFVNPAFPWLNPNLGFSYLVKLLLGCDLISSLTGNQVSGIRRQTSQAQKSNTNSSTVLHFTMEATMNNNLATWRFSVRFQFSICCILRRRTDWVPMNFWQDGGARRKEVHTDCWRYTDRWVFLSPIIVTLSIWRVLRLIYLLFRSFTEQFTLNECLNTGVVLFPLDRHQRLLGQCGRLNRTTMV